MINRHQLEDSALGSQVLLTIVSDTTNAISFLKLLMSHINAFEARFSRFLKDSELTQINNKAGEETQISQPMYELLKTAKNYAALTNGIYNPFILPALQTAGYVGSWPDFESYDTKTDFRHRKIANPNKINLTKTFVNIPKDAAIDLGGIGKGYLLDQLAELTESRRTDLYGYWYSIGGDIICNGHDLDQQPWAVAIQDALDQSLERGKLTNAGKKLGIATSGVTKRKGSGWHHIIDPETGLSKETNILSVTVSASTATAADIYAKTILIGGDELAEEYKRRKRINSYLIQRKSRV